MIYPSRIKCRLEIVRIIGAWMKVGGSDVHIVTKAFGYVSI
jgi:hypothetical protein